MADKDIIISLIEEQLRTYDSKIQVHEEGYVLTIGDGIAICDGLQDIMYGELVEFENGAYGMVNLLEEHSVGIIIFDKQELIKSGFRVRRTKKLMEVEVGDALLGRVVNALGFAIDGGEAIDATKKRPIEKVAPGVMTRKSVDQPLETGIMGIDSMVAIGRGQRELIIGDRQTGKTAIALDAIINQKGKGVLCVYVAIGQKNSTIAQVSSKLREHGASEYTVIVSAGASDSASLQFLAPYMGITLAEEWMSQGKDTLIVFDDLSKHAVAYRTISLLLRRPPGREAYPGDVFYLHSRLLERAANLNEENGGGSITAFPIVETKGGDISGYIPTNVISITDGQIFLDRAIAASGVMPGIDFGLSVSRVGGAAQTQAIRKVAKTLKLDQAQYVSLKAFSQFGSDVDKETKIILDHGERVTKFLIQDQYEPLSHTQQVCLLICLNRRFVKWVPLDGIGDYKDRICSDFVNLPNIKAITVNLHEKGKKLDETIEALEKELSRYTKNHVRTLPNYKSTDYGTIEEFNKL